VAVEYQNLVALRTLLEAGANVNGHQLLPNSLVYAVRQGNMDMVQLLLDHNVDVKQADVHGRTALHAAVEKNSLPMVEKLVAAQAQLNGTCQGATPLEFAYRESEDNSRTWKIASYLLAAGADPKAGRGESLYWEVYKGEVAIVEILLELGLNPNIQTANGKLPLIGAVHRYAGNKEKHAAGLEMIQRLLDAGADPEIPDGDVKTAIQWADSQQYPAATELMRAHVKK